MAIHIDTETFTTYQSKMPSFYKEGISLREWQLTSRLTQELFSNRVVLKQTKAREWFETSVAVEGHGALVLSIRK